MLAAQLPEIFAGTLGIVIAILLVLWMAFWFVVPFMIYGILHRLRRMHEDHYAQQDRMVRLLEQITRGKDGPPARQASDLGSPENPFK